MAKKEKEPFELGGRLIADGLGELTEYAIDGLGPLGLTVIGLKPLVEALRQLGVDHPAMIHGLDVMTFNLLRGFVSNPVLQDAFKEVLDAYFDRVKILSKDAGKGEVEKARGEGLEKAKAKLQTVIAKLKDTMKAFAGVLAILEQEERITWCVWEGAATGDVKKELAVLKSRVDNAHILRDCVMMIANNRDPLVILRSAYGREPTLLETLKSALKGEDTPQTDALAARIATGRSRLQNMAQASRARMAAIRGRRTP